MYPSEWTCHPKYIEYLKTHFIPLSETNQGYPTITINNSIKFINLANKRFIIRIHSLIGLFQLKGHKSL